MRPWFHCYTAVAELLCDRETIDDFVERYVKR